VGEGVIVGCSGDGVKEGSDVVVDIFMTPSVVFVDVEFIVGGVFVSKTVGVPVLLCDLQAEHNKRSVEMVSRIFIFIEKRA